MEEILEPLENYKKFKEDHLKNVTDFFENLTIKSKVDIENNRKTIRNYNLLKEEYEKLLKDKDKVNGTKVFMIVLIVLSFIISISFLFILMESSFNALYFILFTLFLALGIYLIFYIKKSIKNKLEKIERLLKEKSNEIKRLYDESFRQMAPLNELFEDGMVQDLLTKSIPKVSLDYNFDEKKYEYLHDEFGFFHNENFDSSTLICQSGEILNNPFVIVRDRKMKMVLKRYEGFKTISWSERIRVQDGYQTISKSQVLHAYVTVPAPYYYNKTYLVYANDHAPNLTFSREVSEGSNLEGNKKEKFINKRVKELDKMASKAIENNSNFTRVGNDEFEALFDASDRNNEIEFRLLYTPLAQNNILDLLNFKEGYGDDFRQIKSGKINVVQSKHSQTFDYDTSPTRFMGNDYDKMKEFFISFNMNYFKGLYFDLAPLLCVPMYQTTDLTGFKEKDYYPKNLSNHEYEAIANGFDEDDLRPDGCITPLIIKSDFVCKHDDSDEVNIIARGYKGVRRVSYVEVYGGDGRFHTVPVFYTQYLPVSKTSRMLFKMKDSSQKEFNNVKNSYDFKDILKNSFRFQRRILSMLIDGPINENTIKKIDEVYASNKDTYQSIDDITNSLLSEKNKADIIKALKEVNDVKDLSNDNSINAIESKIDKSQIETSTNDN